MYGTWRYFQIGKISKKFVFVNFLEKSCEQA